MRGTGERAGDKKGGTVPQCGGERVWTLRSFLFCDPQLLIPFYGAFNWLRSPRRWCHWLQNSWQECLNGRGILTFGKEESAKRLHLVAKVGAKNLSQSTDQEVGRVSAGTELCPPKVLKTQSTATRQGLHAQESRGLGGGAFHSPAER